MENISINNMIITSAECIYAYDRSSGDLSVYLDQLDNVNISNTEDETDVTGKDGAVLKKIKKNKAVEVTGDNAVWSGSLLSAQTGSDPVSSTTTVVRHLDVIEINGGIGKLTHTPVGTTGNEIGTIFVRSANGDIVSQQKYTQSSESTPSGGSPTFYYNKTDNTIALPSKSTYGSEDDALYSVEDGTIVVVSYDYETNATTITNYADIFGKTLDVWIELIATDTCDKVYKCYLHMPRGQFSGNFDIDLSGDQVMQDFTINNLIDTCSTTASNKLWDFIVCED